MTTELTALEIKILGRIALGYTNNAIARELGISERTMSVKLTRMFGKLYARNRAHAVHIGWKRGILREVVS